MAIREKEKAAGIHVPIIAITAHTLKADRERCLKAGMDGYIAKPVGVEGLFEAIDSLVPSAGTPGMPGKKIPAELSHSGKGWNRVDGDRQFLYQTMELVREESRQLLSAMREAIARQDTKALEDATHALQNSSFPASGTFDSQKSEGVERGANPYQAEEHRALEEEFERVRQALNDLG